MGAAITVEGLRKVYSSRHGAVVALSGLGGLDVVVPVGGMFGFLAANATGKTTWWFSLQEIR